MNKGLFNDHAARIALLMLFFAIVYFFILTPLGILTYPRLKISDSLSKLAADILPGPPSLEDIVIVAVDDDSIRELEKKWPWPRRYYAEMIKRISLHRPRVIALDVTFAGEGDEADDMLLENAIRSAGNVVLASYIDTEGSLIMPLSRFSEAAYGVGFVNKPTGGGEYVRNTRLVYFSRRLGRYLFSFEVLALAAYFGVPEEGLHYERPAILLKKGPREVKAVEVERDGTRAIEYRVPRQAIRTLPFWKILKGDIPSRYLEDKIVMMGATSEAVHDTILTPLGRLPGVIVNANGLTTIISKEGPIQVPVYLVFIFALVLGLITALFIFRLDILKGFFLALTELSLLLFIIPALFFAGLRFDYFAFPLMAVLAFFLSNGYHYSLLLVEGAKLKRKVITDAESGLFTHRYFMLSLHELFGGSVRAKAPLSVVIFMLDNLADITAEYGRRQMAAVMSELKNIIKLVPARGAIASRLSGDRVGVILRNSGYKDALKYGRALKGAVESFRFNTPDGEKALKVSIGIASYPYAQAKSSSDMARCAEFALGKAGGSASGIYIFEPKKDKIVLGVYEEEEGLEQKGEFGYIGADLEQRNRELSEALGTLRRAQKENKAAYFNMIYALMNALEAKDVYTSGHTERVHRFAVALAEGLGLDKEEVELVKEAALLHDIGKIGVPDSVLHKKGNLSDEEFELIKRHEIEGAKILEPMPFFRKLVPMVMHHHERYDGGGYPHGLSGSFIPRGAQIIAIADAFDAMITGRGYNKVLSLKEAADRLIESRGRQFNPEFVDKFVELLDAGKIRI